MIGFNIQISFISLVLAQPLISLLPRGPCRLHPELRCLIFSWAASLPPSSPDTVSPTPQGALGEEEREEDRGGGRSPGGALLPGVGPGGG